MLLRSHLVAHHRLCPITKATLRRQLEPQPHTLLTDSLGSHVRRAQKLWRSFASVGETPSVVIANDKTDIVDKMDFRVGKIISAEIFPPADELYIEKVDIGEEEPRTILSGLRKYVTVDELQGRSVVVIANLPVKRMLGEASHGMLLCASNEDHSLVEPLQPPEAAPPGERVCWGSVEQDQSPPATPNQVKKKKVWQEVQPQLRTDDSRTATFNGLNMMTSAGPVISNLANASIS